MITNIPLNYHLALTVLPRYRNSMSSQDYVQIESLLENYKTAVTSSNASILDLNRTLINQLDELIGDNIGAQKLYTSDIGSTIRGVLLQDTVQAGHGFAIKPPNMLSLDPDVIKNTANSVVLGDSVVFPARVTFSVALCTSAPTIKQMYDVFANKNIICLEESRCDNGRWNAPRNVGECINAALALSKGHQGALTLTGNAKISHQHCLDELNTNEGLEALAITGDIASILQQEICGQHLISN